MVKEHCNEGVGLHYGQYLRPYATTLQYDEQPAYDVQDMIAEHLHALKGGTSVIYVYMRG